MPDFCAMSLSETSIELRSIMSSLAATSSRSAVLLRDGSFVAALVLGCGAIDHPENWPAVSACDGCTQELIERLTKLLGSRKSRAIFQHSSASGRSHMAEAYIVAAARTAGGRKGGRLEG